MRLTIRQLLAAIFGCFAWVMFTGLSAERLAWVLGADRGDRGFAFVVSALFLGGGGVVAVCVLLPGALEHQERLRLDEKAERDWLWKEAQDGMKETR